MAATPGATRSSTKSPPRQTRWSVTPCAVSNFTATPSGILVEDVGAVFFYHRIQGDLFQPYLQGGFRDLNAQNLPGWQ